MAFSVKDWRNANNYAGGGDTSTPLSALALEDMEQRLSDYTDSVTGQGIELGYAQITSTVTGTATTLTDITGLTVTVPTGTRPVMIRFRCDGLSSNAAYLGGVYLNEDGVDLGSLCIASTLTSAAGDRRRNPAAGDHTYKLRYNQNSAGTFTLLAGAGDAGGAAGPAFIQVIQV